VKWGCLRALWSGRKRESRACTRGGKKSKRGSVDGLYRAGTQRFDREGEREAHGA
jgi:hypothetical protein